MQTLITPADLEEVFAAERALLEMDVSRAKRAERIDSAAASFILQGALDRLSSLGRETDFAS